MTSVSGSAHAMGPRSTGPRRRPTWSAGAGRVPSSRRAKCRCNVRADGTGVPGPAWSCRIALTCAADRAGTSRFNAAARSSTAAGGRVAVARRGQQGVETGPAPRQDPPVQRDPRDPDPLPGRAGVLPFCELADQPAPSLGGQGRVGGLPDQGASQTTVPAGISAASCASRSVSSRGAANGQSPRTSRTAAYPSCIAR